MILHGNFDKNYKIIWHEKYNNNDNVISESIHSPFIIPVKDETYAKREYYAKLIPLDDNGESGDDNSALQTNTVQLNVPVIKQTIKDTTYPEANNNNLSKLNNVAPLDNITHTIEIPLNQVHPLIENQTGSFEYKLPKNEKIESIIIDNIPLNNDRYKIKEYDSYKQLSIPITNFSLEFQDNISIIIKTTNISVINQSFKYTGELKITGLLKAPIASASAKFIKNNIEINSDNINFGNIFGLYHKFVERTSPSPNKDIVIVDDTRRNKSRVSLKLNFANGFTQNISKKTLSSSDLPMRLVFFDKNGQRISTPNNEVIVSSSDNGHKLDSLRWKKFQGLKLWVDTFTGLNGSYFSKLTWSIVDSK